MIGFSFSQAARGVLVTGAAALLLAVLPSAAPAAYAPTGRFGEPGSGPGQLSGPAGIAVDEASGDVYVADSANDRVQKFTATGAYLGQFNGSGTLPGEGKAAGGGGLPGEKPTGEFSAPYSIAVDDSGGPHVGDVYVTDVGHDVIDVYDSSGKYLSQLTGTPGPFGKLKAVAVDTHGNVWVYTEAEGEGMVDEFSETGAPITQFRTEHGVEPGFAVDSKGALYLLYGCGCVGKDTAAGSPLAEWGVSDHALAVSLGTGAVFVDKGAGAGIEEFAPFGEPPGELVDLFTSETNLSGSSNGIAVDGADGTVYASESGGGAVSIFKDVGALATASTGEASSVGRGTATVAGTIARGGLATKYYFVYGETVSYGSRTAAVSVVGEEEAITASLTGLQGGTTYHYKLVAENAHGKSFGQDKTFTTAVAVEQVSTGPARAVGQTTATVTGSLAPDGLDTHYHFEYGETEAYGSVSPAPPGNDAGSASQVEPAEARLSGLQPSTIYHYRLVGVNQFGSTRGEDRTLTTLPLAATLSGAPPSVSDVTRTAAIVTGTLDTHGGTVGLRIESVAADQYEPGTANAYVNAASSEVVTVPGARGDQAASVPLQGLLAGTTYHYRFVATDGGGTVYGPDYTFTTAPATPPAVTTGAASVVTQTGVLLTGTVDPRELQTSYEFEVGTDTTYNGAKLFGNAGANGVEAVSASLQFLIPGVTYHYRLVATNEDGTSYGQDTTFTTPGVAAPISQPAALAMVPSPLVTFPSVTGAITKPAGSTGKRHRKRHARARKRAKHAKRRGGARKG